MSAQHTEGPWKLASYNSLFTDNGVAGGDNDVVDQRGRLIAEVTEWGDGADNPNARLIAAAPELLEICETLLRRWGSDIIPPAEKLSYCAEMLRSIIAKARGES